MEGNSQQILTVADQKRETTQLLDNLTSSASLSGSPFPCNFVFSKIYYGSRMLYGIGVSSSSSRLSLEIGNNLFCANSCRYWVILSNVRYVSPNVHIFHPHTVRRLPQLCRKMPLKLYPFSLSADDYQYLIHLRASHISYVFEYVPNIRLKTHISKARSINKIE